MNYITLGILIFIFLFIIFYPIRKKNNNIQYKSKNYFFNNELFTQSYDFVKYLILKN